MEKYQTQQRRLSLYEQVLELNRQGLNQTEIAEHLKISRRRVREYLKVCPTAPVYSKQPTKLEPFKEYLQSRFFDEGAGNSLQLFREICERGYQGCQGSVVRYVTLLRYQPASKQPSTGRLRTRPQTLTAKVASPREIAWWFLLPEQRLSEKQSQNLARLCQHQAELLQLYRLVQEFKAILNSGKDRAPTGWFGAVGKSGVSELESFRRVCNGMKPL